MRLVWVVIPLVLIGIIGIQESFADNQNVSTVTKNGLILTLHTDKSEYTQDELIHFMMTIENSNSFAYWYQGRDGCHYTNESNMDFEIKELGHTVVLLPTTTIGDGMMCTEATVGASFEPLEIVTKEFAWNQSYFSNRETLEISPGIYTLEGKLRDVTDDGFENPLETEVTFEILKDKKLSPKQQMKNGILPSKVECKADLELIFKSSDNSPACVTPETAEKLIERGWLAKIQGPIYIALLSPEKCEAQGGEYNYCFPCSKDVTCEECTEYCRTE